MSKGVESKLLCSFELTPQFPDVKKVTAQFGEGQKRRNNGRGPLPRLAQWRSSCKAPEGMPCALCQPANKQATKSRILAAAAKTWTRTTKAERRMRKIPLECQYIRVYAA